MLINIKSEFRQCEILILVNITGQLFILHSHKKDVNTYMYNDVQCTLYNVQCTLYTYAIPLLGCVHCLDFAGE